MGGDVETGLKKALGQIGTLDFECSESQMSQAVIQTEGAPLIVNVKSIKASIAKGSRVVLVEKNLEGDFYYVQKVH